MDAKKHYQQYWTSKKGLERFMGYERNWYLADLFSKDEKVLDVGCGDGAVAEYLRKALKADVIGVDISENAIKKARKRGVDARLANIETDGLPFASGDFDAVFWGDNVEHLFDPNMVLREIARVLKTGGRLILSCPNMGYWKYRLHYLLNGALPDTEWTGNPPWGWSHIRFFNLKILKDFLESQGLTVAKTIGVNRRPVDRLLAKISPSLFGMILIIKAKKD